MWRPTEWLSVVMNNYIGADTLGAEGRVRFHTGDSVMVRYHHAPGGFLSKAAASLTIDLGCEQGGGVSCGDQPPPGGSQGAPGSMVTDWTPDLANTEDRLTLALLVRI